MESRTYKLNLRNVFLTTMDELAPRVLNEMTSQTTNALAKLKATYGESLELCSQQGKVTGYLKGNDENCPPTSDFEELNTIIHEVLASYHIDNAWMIAASCNTLTSASGTWIPFVVPLSGFEIKQKWDPSSLAEKEFRQQATESFEKALRLQKQQMLSGVRGPNIRQIKKEHKKAMASPTIDKATIYNLLYTTDALWQMDVKGVGHEFRLVEKHMNWFVRYQILGHSMSKIADTQPTSTVSRQLALLSGALGMPLRESTMIGRPPKGADSDPTNP